MAWTKTNVDQLDRIAKKFADAGARLAAIVEVMRSTPYPVMMAQVAAAEQAARRAIAFANEVDHHLPNQIECAATGQLADWEVTHRRGELNKLRRAAQKGDPTAVAFEAASAEAKTDRISKGIDPPPRKKATKKKK